MTSGLRQYIAGFIVAIFFRNPGQMSRYINKPDRVLLCCNVSRLSGRLIGWFVSGSMALSENVSIYIEPSPREREKEKRNDKQVGKNR